MSQSQSAAYRSSWMTSELEILRDSVATFLDREFVPHSERWLEVGQIDRDAWSKAGAAGLLCASIPTEYGGGGGTWAHESVVIEEVARKSATAAGIHGFNNGVHSAIVAHYVNSFGTEDQKQRWLPKLASGELVGAIAMTEPGTGSDLQNVKTTAIADGDEYVVTGQKTFISNGQHAGLVVVVAKTEPEARARGISLVCVETEGTAGYVRGRNLAKLGQHAADTSELFFEDVRVPRDFLLGAEEGRGFGQLMDQLPAERLLIAQNAVVAMEEALRLTAEYVKERRAFGQAIADFQNTRFTLAECKTEAHIARVFIDQCVERLMAGTLDASTASMAKWWTTQKQCEIIDSCLQLFGGYGYMDEYPISRMYADARVQKIYGGSNEIMKELISRTI